MNTNEQTYNTNTNAMGTHTTTAPTGAYDSTNHTTTNSAVGTAESGHKATTLEKLKGKMESVAGALTGDHKKQREGDMRAAGDHPDQHMNEKGQMTSSQPKSTSSDAHHNYNNSTYNNNTNNNVYDPANNAAHANQDAFHHSGYTNTNTNTNAHDSSYGSHDNNNVGKPTMTENLKGKMQQGMGAMTGNEREQVGGMARQEGTHSNQYMDQNGRMTSTVADNNSTRDLPDHATNPTLTASGAGAGIHHGQGQHGQMHEERDVTLGQTLQGKAQAAMGAMTGNQAKKQEGELRQDGMHPDQRMDALGRVTGASTDTGFNAASNDHYQATPGTHQNQTPYGVTTGSLNQQPMHGNATGINTAGSYPNTSEYGRGPNENLDSHHNQAGHASLGDRISGAMHQQKGRMMNDPEEVRQGQMLSDGTLPTQHNQTTHNQQTNHY